METHSHRLLVNPPSKNPLSYIMDNIIDLPTPEPPQPQPRTMAELQADTAADIIGRSRGCFEAMVATHNSLMELFWNHPQGLTPQQVSDSLGTAAASLFILGGQLQQLCNAVKPESCPKLPSHAFTINPDGTVTVLNEPYAG